MSKLTLSVIKADVGGWVGHSGVHPDLLARAEKSLSDSKLLKDFYVAHVGDDINLIMTHDRGVDNQEIHQLAWDTFLACTEVAKELKMYGAGQDLLADAFAGNVKGMGPGVAEMEFTERSSEPVVILMADKTEPGAWNLPLYKIFADPFNTIGLVIDPKMHAGFIMEVHDLLENKKINFSLPEDLYDLLVFIGAPGRFAVKAVYSKTSGEIASVSSTQRLNLMAGRYVGKDDPVCIVRCQSGLPAVGEVVEPFANPHLVAGWMRGSHMGPLMPVGIKDACPIRFDGRPGDCPDSRLPTGSSSAPGSLPILLTGPEGQPIGRLSAKPGTLRLHRLPLEDMEYTTMPQVMEKLKGRFEPIEEEAAASKEE